MTQSPIDNLDSMHLIGTNILTLKGSHIPHFEIENKENIKYKKIVREKCKESWNIKNKYITSIKHINNYKNFHNYLVLLDNSKSVSKFVKKYKNQMHHIGDGYCWRTFLGIYSPESIDPSKRDVYQSISNSTINSLSLKIRESKLELKNIYKSISFCIGDDKY